MTDRQKEQREFALTVSGGRCAVCGEPLNRFSTPQGAHKIADTKNNRAKYGSLFIDSPLNIAMVCSLKCNDACNIGNNRGKVLDLLADIVIDEIKRGRNG